MTSNQTHPHILDYSYQQRERLAFIDFCLYFLGEVTRQNLINRFGIAPAVTTRDFAAYKTLAGQNLFLNGSTKTYVATENFYPLFEHHYAGVISQLIFGFGISGSEKHAPVIHCEHLPVLNEPCIEVLSGISKAINQKRAVRMKYFSASSGATQREIVPFALVSDGLRWHTRGFDRKTGEFRDFVLTRMENVQVLNPKLEEGVVQMNETMQNDDQWMRMVEVDLVPHPKNQQPEMTIRDFNMVNGVKRVKLRAAVAGYMLQQWHVDCSPNQGISDKAFRLCLGNPLQLYGVKSMEFSPGYHETI